MPASVIGRPLTVGERDAAGVGVGDGAARMAGTGVVADEERHAEARVARRLDHAVRLLALHQTGARIQLLRSQVEHLAVAVVDRHVRRPAVRNAPSTAAFASPFISSTDCG